MIYYFHSVAWVDVSWATSMTENKSAESATSNEDDPSNSVVAVMDGSNNVKVVNIADPTVAEAMMQAERMDKNASNKNNRNNATTANSSTPSSTATLVDDTLKQVLSFAKKSNQEKGADEDASENNKDSNANNDNEVNEADAKQGDNRYCFVVCYLPDVLLYNCFIIQMIIKVYHCFRTCQSLFRWESITQTSMIRIAVT